MKISTSINNSVIDKIGAEKAFEMIAKSGLDAIDFGLLVGYNDP